MWAALKRFQKSVFGKDIVKAKIQDLVITTRRKDFVFEELEGLPDNFRFALFFDGDFYSLYSDWQPEES